MQWRTHKTPSDKVFFGEISRYPLLQISKQRDRITWKCSTGPFQFAVWLETKTQSMGFDHKIIASVLWCWSSTEGIRPLLWPRSAFRDSANCSKRSLRHFYLPATFQLGLTFISFSGSKGLYKNGNVILAGKSHYFHRLSISQPTLGSAAGWFLTVLSNVQFAASH